MCTDSAIFLNYTFDLKPSLQIVINYITVKIIIFIGIILKYLIPLQSFGKFVNLTLTLRL